MEIKLASKQISGPFWPVVFFAFAAVFLVVAAYGAGAIQTLGYESRTVKSHGFTGNFTGNKSGYALGLKQFYYRAGQEFFARYDVDVRTGALDIRLRKSWEPLDRRNYFEETILEDGQGEVRFRIRESGFYTVIFEGSVLGADRSASGYDLSYEVRWGAR